MNAQNAILDVIKNNTVLGERVFSISNESNLLDEGVDSLQMMKVIVEIEQFLGFEFSDEELIMVNFSSVGAIVSAVERKCS